MDLNDTLFMKIKNVKIVISDVDGVLTDGGLYYNSDGLIMKKFNVKDGMGVRLLKETGIKNAIITTDTSELIKIRANRLSIEYVFLGIWDKASKMREICSLENINPENIAFIGDDVNDLGIINEAGFTTCPSDAVQEVKSSVDLILNNKGGDGVFRELANLIIKYKN